MHSLTPGSISFCGDRIWVDVTLEKYAHNQIKGRIAHHVDSAR